MGLLYGEGHGVAQDYAKAIEWYRKAADGGNARAMFNIGALYEDGHGVHTDHAKAMEWYRKAADLGDQLAIDHLKGP